MTKVKFTGGSPVVPAAGDGPVPALLASELTLARSGALDTDLLAQQPFYGTNFTKPLLFIEDGSYFVNKATAMGLTGSQWGVMNETGSYPGQPWLWLYTLWYQVPGWTNSANIDMIAIYMTGLATIVLLLVPFIPGLRDIPRLIPVHRLIWRTRDYPAPSSGSGPGQGRAPALRTRSWPVSPRPGPRRHDPGHGKPIALLGGGGGGGATTPVTSRVTSGSRAPRAASRTAPLSRILSISAIAPVSRRSLAGWMVSVRIVVSWVRDAGGLAKLTSMFSKLLWRSVLA